MLISLLFLVIIYILFQKLNKLKKNTYLRLYKGFEVVSQGKAPDIRKFIELKEEKERLERDNANMKMELESLQLLLQSETHKLKSKEILLEGLQKIYDDLVKAIDDSKKINTKEYSLKTISLLLYMKIIIDENLSDVVSRSLFHFRNVFYMHQISRKFNR